MRFSSLNAPTGQSYSFVQDAVARLVSGAADNNYTFITEVETDAYVTSVGGLTVSLVNGANSNYYWYTSGNADAFVRGRIIVFTRKR